MREQYTYFDCLIHLLYSISLFFNHPQHLMGFRGHHHGSNTSALMKLMLKSTDGNQ